MFSHEADLSGRTFDALRRSLGAVFAKNRKEIQFIGAVGEIALIGSHYSIMLPESAGPVLHFSSCLWRELQLNHHSRSMYQKLYRAKGDIFLFGSFGSVVLVTHTAKRRQLALSLQSTKGLPEILWHVISLLSSPWKSHVFFLLGRNCIPWIVFHVLGLLRSSRRLYVIFVTENDVPVVLWHV